MGPRTRKAIATLLVLAWLCLYVWVVVSLSAHVPDLWWTRLIYYAIAGTAWGLPLLPLLKWAEGARD